MSTYKFSVNVVVRHPSRRAEEVALALDWTPLNAWSVGDSRVTPAGTQLLGIRGETMCAFRFEHDEDQATSAVTETVIHLLARRSYVEEFVLSGGTVALNIGINGQFNSSFDLSHEILQAVSALGISLAVECFPDG